MFIFIFFAAVATYIITSDVKAAELYQWLVIYTMTSVILVPFAVSFFSVCINRGASSSTKAVNLFFASVIGFPGAIAFMSTIVLACKMLP